MELIAKQHIGATRCSVGKDLCYRSKKQFHFNTVFVLLMNLIQELSRKSRVREILGYSLCHIPVSTPLICTWPVTIGSKRDCDELSSAIDYLRNTIGKLREVLTRIRVVPKRNWWNKQLLYHSMYHHHRVEITKKNKKPFFDGFTIANCT